MMAAGPSIWASQQQSLEDTQLESSQKAVAADGTEGVEGDVLAAAVS